MQVHFKGLLFLLIFLCCSCFAPQFARADEVKLATLDWPPFTGESLPGQGLNSDLIRRVFESMGKVVNFGFFPWSRAVTLAKDSVEYVGYFPEYYDPKLERDFYLSDPIGETPLVFAERKNHPVAWNSIEDLKRFRIGVVQDYVNTQEIDRAIAQKELKVDIAISDLINLRKLLNDRVDLIVIDKNVFYYLLQATPDLVKEAEKLQVNKKELEMKKLYVCFQKSAKGLRERDDFNKALKKISKISSK